MFWLQGVIVGNKFNVKINEIDVCPVQIQGPKSEALMSDLVGPGIHDIPYYGLMEAKVGGHDVIISQSGFSGEKGYEIYLRDATLQYLVGKIETKLVLLLVDADHPCEVIP